MCPVTLHNVDREDIIAAGDMSSYVEIIPMSDQLMWEALLGFVQHAT
jgi:hypothetical protein